MKKINTQVLFVILVIALPLTLFWVVDSITTKNQELQILGPTTKDDSGNTVDHTIEPFSFINQEGREITEEEFTGSIYIANFFFAVCPIICPAMTNQLYRVQEAFAGNDKVKFISHSVDPVRDSVPVLKDFAERFDINASQWHLVTGDKKAIYRMARNSYMVAVLEGDGGPFDFIHSELLVLVDKHRRIRGYYEGTNEKEVDRLIKHIETLLKET